MAFILSLREDLTLSDRGPGELQLQVPGRPATVLSFRQVTPAIRDVISRLHDGGVGEDALAGPVLERDGPQGLFKLTHFLTKLEGARLICRSLAVHDRPIVRLVPIAERFALADAPAARVALSRFAVIRRSGDNLIVESPLGYARLELRGPDAMLAVGALVSPLTAVALADRVQWSADEATAFLQLLASAGVLTEVDAAGVAAEDRNAALRQWEFHDLYFHSRSRIGRHANPFGGTFAFDGTLPPLPALKPTLGGAHVTLARPDIERLIRDDIPFTQVVEARRSVRDQGSEPITVGQLGEFLFRAARVTAVWPTDHGEVSQRVYPAGGALYETEIYAVVDRVTGLDSGLYHYDPSGHAFERVSDRTPRVQALLDQAFFTADQRSRPQVLLVLTARFQRMQWKYQSMVYAAVLKHVGVLYQQMYLVATAMGLAPCALGGGHSDLFAEAAGLDYYAETSVGEFILGTRLDAARDGSRFEDPR